MYVEVVASQSSVVFFWDILYNLTKRSQHSQECKDPHWHLFVTRDLEIWSSDAKINGFPEVIVEHLYVKFGDSSCIVFWDIVQKKRHTTEMKTCPCYCRRWQCNYFNHFLFTRFVNISVRVMLLLRCHWIHGRDGEVRRFLPNDQEIVVRNVIEPMASNGLRTICLAYKEFVTGIPPHRYTY